jgi:hypothetical protein
MALIVEDGTGLATAEAYISVADAGTRHSNLGNTAWTGTDAAKEAALRKATEYMTQAYRGRWQGIRLNETQALDWPRSWVTVDGYAVASNSVPADIANACADLALRALSADLNADLERGVVREKVGPLETEYDRNSPQATRYRAIDMALAPYLGRGSSAYCLPVVRT